jgi:hypothetical protein
MAVRACDSHGLRRLDSYSSRDFREPRDYCKRQCTPAPRLLKRKFYYLFTCEILLLTRYKLLLED